MNQRGQSTVEPMLAITFVVLILVFAGYVFHAQFEVLVSDVAEWIAHYVEIP